MLNQFKNIEIDTLTKRVEAKKLIKALQFVGTPLVDIVFNKKSDEIIVKHPRNENYSVLFAKN